MSKSFIIINDLNKNTQYIFNKIPIQYIQDGFKECFNAIQKQFPLQKLNYTINNEKCEIYTENTVINKGWVWTSSYNTKAVLFVLSSIDLYNQRINEQKDVYTQTEIIKEKKHTETVSISDVSIPTHSSSTNVIYGTGYAPSILFPELREQLTIELKNKLASPNYGLRNICSIVNQCDEYVDLN